MNDYKIKVTNYKDNKDAMWSLATILKVFKFNNIALNPNSYQLMAIKQAIAKSLELDINDVTIYMNGQPILQISLIECHPPGWHSIKINNKRSK